MKEESIFPSSPDHTVRVHRSSQEMNQPESGGSKRWTNHPFLDQLRQMGDQLADECFWELKSYLGKDDFSGLFKKLKSNNQPLTEDIPRPLKEFIYQTTKLPLVHGEPMDCSRIKRGQKVFMTHALPSALVLLTKSLPEGYAAPNLSKVLCLSDNLTERPYRRLLGVLQMVINVSAVGGFDPKGKALITIPKIRLLHAGVRHIVRKHCSSYEKHHGVPVNIEDLLGTVMGFSYLVIDGLKQLDIGLTNEEAEDFFYLWRIFTQMMGIHPEHNPNSTLFVPANLEEAQVFYETYKDRHFVEASHNPEGVLLAKANLQMLNDLLPQTPLRRLGLKIVPRMYMEELMGKEGYARTGLEPIRFLYLTKWVLRHLPGVWTRLWNVHDQFDPSKHFHENLSRIFFQHLINVEFGGEVTFRIPDTLVELKKLA